MKKCSICSRELGVFEEKHYCLNGCICDSCYLQARVPAENLKNMSLNEVKNEIFLQESTPLNSDLIKSRTSTSWICPTCGNENKGSDEICTKCLCPKYEKKFNNKTSKPLLIALSAISGLVLIAIIFAVSHNLSKNNSDNKLAVSNSSQAEATTEAVTTTAVTRTTTKKTTTAATIATPTFDKGEEIWVKGTVSDISNNKLTLKDYDGFTWSVNCSKIEDSDKFESLLLGKDVKITGKVTGDLKVDFVDVELGGKTYTTANFSKEQFIANCVEVPYKDLARNPDDYKGKNIKVKIQISQVMSGGWFTESGYRGYEDYDFDLDDDSATYLKKEWYISYELDDGESKILEDDVVIFYGEFNGAEKMERALTGTTDYVPNLNAKYYEIVS